MPDRVKKNGVDLDLRRQTRGERLRVWREREGLTQGQAAERFGVGRNVWCSAELDRKTHPDLRLPVGLAPTTAELLLLARRRSGLGLRRAARGVGISHAWLLKMERAGDPRVADFWRGRGFRFPKPLRDIG